MDARASSTWQAGPAVVAAVLAGAAHAFPEEGCGLLLGPAGGRRVLRTVAARNIHPHPQTRFEIDPVALLAAHRQSRGGGEAVLGCWHSHPSGPARPSVEDAARAADPGWLWLIVGFNTGRAIVGAWETICAPQQGMTFRMARLVEAG